MTTARVFDEWDRRAIAFAEQYWMGYKKLVTPEMLYETFGKSKKFWSNWLQEPEVIDAFNRRTIPLIPSPGLAPDELALANALLDFADKRSFNKKLSDLGMTSAKYQQLLKKDEFSEYLRKRSEDLLKDALPEAHLALVDNVRRGDLQSIKFFYEISGRYSSRDEEINVAELLSRILEIISRHIQNPEQLKAISADFKHLDKPSNIEVVAGEVVPPVANNNPERLSL